MGQIHARMKIRGEKPIALHNSLLAGQSTNKQALYTRNRGSVGPLLASQTCACPNECQIFCSFGVL